MTIEQVAIQIFKATNELDDHLRHSRKRLLYWQAVPYKPEIIRWQSRCDALEQALATYRTYLTDTQG